MVAFFNQPLQLTVTEVVADNDARFQCLEIDIAVPKLDPIFLIELKLQTCLTLRQVFVLLG